MASGSPLFLYRCAGKLKNLATFGRKSEQWGGRRLNQSLVVGISLLLASGWDGVDARIASATTQLATTQIDQPANHAETLTSLPPAIIPPFHPVTLQLAQASGEDIAVPSEGSETDRDEDGRQRPTANTLEPDLEDDLLPSGAAEGKLSAAELQAIRLSAAQLDQEAEAAYGQGDRLRAYQLWFRALRLLQYGQADEEIVALGRIGARAWREGLAAESQAIAQRLLTLDTEATSQTKTINPSQTEREQVMETQAKLALAHEQVGALDPAIERYEWLLEQNQQLKRADSEQQLVGKLTQLNLARLDYPQATRYTEIQLEQLRRQPRQNPLTETQLIEQLVYLHEQNSDWDAAIAQQQLLLQRSPTRPTGTLGNPTANTQNRAVLQRPAILLALGRNQERAGLNIAATQTYQEAYRTAQEQQQFDVSHKSLARLAAIYESQAQVEDALTVYNVLRRVDELSYNLFGLLNTYESMGELQASRGDRDAAIQSFQQALHAAKQLDYRVTDIQDKLSTLQQN